jgi:hypothetical protein
MVLEPSADAALAFPDSGTAAAVLVNADTAWGKDVVVLAGVALLLLAFAVVVVLRRRFALSSASGPATHAPSEVC